uniref:CUB and Sushi multiple domains 3a n=1 Tax=Hippocampus comes TaxID=109280 RepID=A0A3Q2Z1X2_HIPCM
MPGRFTWPRGTYSRYVLHLPLCGGRFKSESTGRILSPGYPFPYDNNLRCTWTIEVDSGNIFLAFDTEASHDMLRVWDGPPTNEMSLAELSGSLLPEGIHSTLNTVTVQFETDFYISKSGFAIQDPGVPMNGTRSGDGREPGDSVSFQCDPGYELQGDDKITCIQVDNRYYWQPSPPVCIAPCGGNLTGSSEGTVLSPNFPRNYTTGQTCVYSIAVPREFGIHLQFVNFSTEAIHDYLEIRSGSLETGSVIDRFSGPLIPRALFSTTHQTSFFFHNPRPFRNGIVIGTDFSVGMTVSFECLPGYSLIGDASLTCLHGLSRNWNHPLPRCAG